MANKAFLTVGEFKTLMREMYKNALLESLRAHIKASAYSFQGADSDRDDDSRYMERVNEESRAAEKEAVFQAGYARALRMAIRTELGELDGLDDEEELYSFPEGPIDMGVSEDTEKWADEALQEYNNAYSTLVCGDAVSTIFGDK